MSKKSLNGVFAPITTPFLENGEVDYRGLESNMEFYKTSKIKGYHALGTNGENKSLTNDEKIKILKTVIKGKSANKIVMAGCNFESTRETIENAKIMEQAGADIITLLPPGYFKRQMTEMALYRYFSDVADAISIPCLIYNAPQFCGDVEVSIALAIKLADHPNIIAIKDSSKGNIENFLFSVNDKISVLAGSANFFMNALLLGGAGGIISFASAFPAIICELYDKLILEKNYTEAIALNERIIKLNKGVSGIGGVAAVKYAMDLAGLVGGLPRLPLLPIGEDVKLSIKKALLEGGLMSVNMKECHQER